MANPCLDVQGAGDSLGLMQFDLSGLGADKVIVSATLRLYQVWNSQNTTEYSVFVNNAAWSAPAQYGSRPGTEATAEASLVLDGALDLYREWNVSGAVQAWYTGSKPNYGVTLAKTAGADYWTYFRGSNSSAAPELVIDYVVVPEPSTMLLACAGLASVAFVRRRK